MRSNHIPPFDQLEPRDGVLVVDGYGIALTVHHGQIVFEDGIGRSRRTRRFPRAGHGLKRVVLLGSSGYISLEAIRWLDRLNIPLIHITADGNTVLASTHLGLRNARLRRAQALAAGSKDGLELSRYLLGRKIDGQLDVARRIGDATEVEKASSRVDDASTLDALLKLEARAALEYWALWEDLPIRFVTRDQKRVPQHWLTFGTRSSIISGRGPRLASNPPNALLNYTYSLLEAETVIACHAVGLDPQLGFFHADTPGRDSLAADLMEAVRPTVDQFVLDLIAEHRFTRKEFIETHRGVCRLARPIAHRLSETTIRWAVEIAPVVEHVARTLTPDGPTLLTQVRRRVAHGGSTNQLPAAPTELERACLDCGEQSTRTGDYCASCAERRKLDFIPELSARATAYLARARERGHDPAHGGIAAARRGKVNRQRQQEIREWESINERPSPETFNLEILPGLSAVTAGEMARATGLSRPYCSMIKRGAYVPHPKHWDVLGRLPTSVSST